MRTESETNEELPVQQGYAAWAPWYDHDGNPLTALEGPAVRGWLGPLAGKLALDLGCGTGRHTEVLVSGGARVVALDLTPEMIARARAKLGGRVVGWARHALPGPIPFRDRTFDLAVLGLVAEHVVDLPAALAEVARVLAPSARVVLSALHPDRTAEGQRARYIDPATGLRRPIATVHRTLDDYRAAARSAGLRPLGEQTLIVTPDLGRRLPRAARYVGLPLGWVGCWERPAGGC